MSISGKSKNSEGGNRSVSVSKGDGGNRSASGSGSGSVSVSKGRNVDGGGHGSGSGGSFYSETDVEKDIITSNASDMSSFSNINANACADAGVVMNSSVSLCSGPYIPEVDCGYNVSTNGISINFLKDPFCFKNNFLFGKNHLNENIKKTMNSSGGCANNTDFLKDKINILKPLTKTKIVEVPKYIYKEKIVHKTEIVNKNIYVPQDMPIYVTRKVKVPVYKEEIKYVPTIIEKEKIYEIPKLEIYDLIQENLLYLHKNNIQYKKHRHVVERLIPKLNKRIVEKTVQIPSIQHPDISNYEVTNTSTSENLCPDNSIDYDAYYDQRDLEKLRAFTNKSVFSNSNEKREALETEVNTDESQSSSSKIEKLVQQRIYQMEEETEEKVAQGVVQRTENNDESFVQKNEEVKQKDAKAQHEDEKEDNKSEQINEENEEDEKEETTAKKTELKELPHHLPESDTYQTEKNIKKKDKTDKDTDIYLNHSYTRFESRQLNFTSYDKSIENESNTHDVTNDHDQNRGNENESATISSISDNNVINKGNSKSTNATRKSFLQMLSESNTSGNSGSF